ncbi:hypothetical protein Ciccas_011474 [Cichlidogyrus casuarinus]|uniref:Uncharacterized protein n=1 Tax=Cichlidogyrus casuarinus TaxID=1844966 RepID=A0ABD2PU36_9PLAT
MQDRVGLRMFSESYIGQLVKANELTDVVHNEKKRYTLTSKEVTCRQQSSGCYSDQLKGRIDELLSWIRDDYLKCDNVFELSEYLQEQREYLLAKAEQGRQLLEQMAQLMQSERQRLSALLSEFSNHVDCLWHYVDLFELSDEILRHMKEISHHLNFLSKSIPFTEQQWPTEDSTLDPFTVHADLRRLEKVKFPLLFCVLACFPDWHIPAQLEQLQQLLCRTNPKLVFTMVMFPEMSKLKAKSSFDSASCSEDEEQEEQEREERAFLLDVGSFAGVVSGKLCLQGTPVKLHLKHLRKMPFFCIFDSILCQRLQDNWRELNNLKALQKWLNEFHPPIELMEDAERDSQALQRQLSVLMHQWSSFEQQLTAVSSCKLVQIEQLFNNLRMRCQGLSQCSARSGHQDLGSAFEQHFTRLQATVKNLWHLFNDLVNSKKRRLDTACCNLRFQERQRALMSWIRLKKNILLDTDAINTKRLGGITKLQRVLYVSQRSQPHPWLLIQRPIIYSTGSRYEIQ